MGSYCMPDTSDGQLPGCQPRGQDLAGAEYIHEQPLSSLLELTVGQAYAKQYLL